MEILKGRTERIAVEPRHFTVPFGYTAQVRHTPSRIPTFFRFFSSLLIIHTTSVVFRFLFCRIVEIERKESPYPPMYSEVTISLLSISSVAVPT